jgi:hypothetical protein
VISSPISPAGSSNQTTKRQNKDCTEHSHKYPFGAELLGLPLATVISSSSFLKAGLPVIPE